jgi:hypothetical protein
MKIYWSSVFDDYLFERNGKFMLAMHTSSLKPKRVGWITFKLSHTNGLQLITEV